MHQDFTQYIHSTFFVHDPEGFEAFQQALHKPLKKTIRINTKRSSIDSWKQEHDTWTLQSTRNARVFAVDRPENERYLALGSTQEHLGGEFYIQELAASMSVEVLANMQFGNSSPDTQAPHIILDMCASPGGKTTQLSETFPNAWIVANESSKDRLPQLIENTERMGAESISLCLDNGMHYGENHPEAYDIILLDAPCSGEGTAFKHDTAVSFWNEKGIKKIARLQGKLIESAWKALKPGGWLLYSTCTLNTFENEEVLAHLQSLPDFDGNILFQKRFWPHIDEAGGFFICKIQKGKGLPQGSSNRYIHGSREIRPISRQYEAAFHQFIQKIDWKCSWNYRLFEFRNEILLVRNHEALQDLLNHHQFLRFGIRAGKIEQGKFIPNHFFAFTGRFQKATQAMLTEKQTHKYLSGSPLPLHEIQLQGPLLQSLDDDFLLLVSQKKIIGIAPVRNMMIENIFPKEWRRK